MASNEPAHDAGGRRRRVAPGDAARLLFLQARAWVRSTPGTHTWLLILAVTSGILAAVSPHIRGFLLHHNSTNLEELGSHPVRVLIVSALWIESPQAFLPYFLFYEVVHAPAERRLGTRRWLAVVAVAHVGATLISQQAVFLGIHADRLSPSMAHTVDIGVSYGLAGVVGVLTHYLRPPWRWLYLAAAGGFFAYPLLLSGRTYTDLGHFTALLIGLACRGLIPRGRAAPAPPRYRPRRWRP
ncbi:rhomboid-like protein [Streptomyces sp. NPDC058691]|uniref:rhomboid-like protein n=1 Tax=Streptomyces sp. NPDC058691 TaxID=3346601 RepID=UPI00365F9F3B